MQKLQKQCNDRRFYIATPQSKLGTGLEVTRSSRMGYSRGCSCLRVVHELYAYCADVSFIIVTVHNWIFVVEVKSLPALLLNYYCYSNCNPLTLNRICINFLCLQLYWMRTERGSGRENWPGSCFWTSDKVRLSARIPFWHDQKAYGTITAAQVLYLLLIKQR